MSKFSLDEARRNPKAAMQGWANGYLLTIPEAIEKLEYARGEDGKGGQGAWGAAVEKHDFLKAALVKRTSFHPQYVLTEAVEQYKLSKGTGGGGSRGGPKQFVSDLSEEEAADLAAYASAKFNRTVLFEQPTARAKRIKATKAELSTIVAQNGVEDEDVEDAEDAELEDAEA